MTSIPPFPSQFRPTNWRAPVSQTPSPILSFPDHPSKLGILGKDASTDRRHIQGTPITDRLRSTGGSSVWEHCPSFSPQAMEDTRCISPIPNLRPSKRTARQRLLSEQNAQRQQCHDCVVAPTVQLLVHCLTSLMFRFILTSVSFHGSGVCVTAAACSLHQTTTR